MAKKKATRKAKAKRVSKPAVLTIENVSADAAKFCKANHILPDLLNGIIAHGLSDTLGDSFVDKWHARHA